MKARRKRIARSRDPHVGREEARRFAANVSMAILIVGGIAAVIALANRWLAKEELHGVRIIGRVVLDSAEIMQQAAIPKNVPLRKLDLQSIETRIVSHPFIARASVYRAENGTLVVEIAERTPLAVTFIDGAPVYLDSTAFALPYRFSTAGFDIPVVSGVVDADHIDSARAREAINVVRTLRDYESTVNKQISEIRRESDGQYTFFTAEGAVPVRIGFPSDISSRLPKLDAFMTHILSTENVRRAEYIDLRWQGEVVVKWREERGSQV